MELSQASGLQAAKVVQVSSYTDAHTGSPWRVGGINACSGRSPVFHPLASHQPAHNTRAQACIDDGLLLVAAGPQVVRLVPPLIVTEAQVDEAVKR